MTPTSRLPPISKIAAFTSIQLLESLQYLQSFHHPQVRGSRRKREGKGDDDLTSDAFERTYAIRWLTALIVQLEARQELSSLTPTHTAVDASLQPPSSDPSIDTDTLIQQAASLLAIYAGVAAAGKVHHRFTFESPSTAIGSGINKIHVDLTDLPLDNQDYASVGAQTWGGACVLAEMIAQRPHQFGLGSHVVSTDGLDAPPLRMLELGAGTGLVGLTIATCLQALSIAASTSDIHPRATVVLTDFYPAVLANLRSNIAINFPTEHASILVTAHPLDWSSFSTIPQSQIPDVLSTPFDLVFGADIVYETRHAIWIRDCLTSLLSRPDGAHKDPAFHLVIPLRPTHTFECSTVEEVFGSSEGSTQRRELVILSKESILCEAYGDGWSKRSRADGDVEYVYYRIGWSR